jgi:RND family efflux transporter MFP subunit
MPPKRPRRRRTRRLIAIGSIGAIAVTGILAGRAIADTPSGTGRYRTATVTRTSVDQTLQRSGTVEPVAQATVAFPISGTVAGVSMQPGDTVTTGQTLATIDTTALQSTLTQKQAALAAAQLTLEKALTATPSTSSASSSGPSSTASTATAALQSAARSVTTGQKQVDDALTQARAALEAAATACASQSNATPSSTTSTTAPSSSSSASDACAQALQNALAGQQDVATAQSSLADGESSYADALGAASANATAAAPAASASGPAAPQSAASSSTAAELVADQAAVDAAAQEVTAAQQNLAQGTIVSPFAGTVAAVGLKSGDAVSAGSSTADVVVVGPGGYEVTTTVPVADIGKVGIGDTASVSPDGAAQAIAGKVVSIGMAPTTSGTTTTYPVVVGLTEQASGLRNGASAAVTIVLDHAADALAVPTSAIRSTGRGQTVIVLANGTETVTPVQVGVLGSELTEIRSGLQQGDTVVLADLDQAIPSSTASTNRFGGGAGIGGGLGGGGIGRVGG